MSWALQAKDSLGDLVYDLAIERGEVLCAQIELPSPDAALILAAMAERGVTLQTAVEEALVDWAMR